MSNKNVVALDLPIPEIKDMPEDTQKYFQICQEKLGMIPNVLTAYSQNLKQLDGFTRLYNELMLGESELSKLEREMVAVVVSSENKCFYCLVAHGAAVRVLSGDPQLGEHMVMNYRSATLDKRQLAGHRHRRRHPGPAGCRSERPRHLGSQQPDRFLQHVQPRGDCQRYAT